MFPLVAAISLGVLVAAWQLGAMAGVINVNLFPAPSTVAGAAVELMQTGQYWRDLGASLGRAGTGFLIALVLGVGMGLLTGRLLVFQVVLEPVLQILRPIPGIAWVPFAILWFGVGELPKIFIVTLGAVLPIWLNTHIGASSTPVRHLETAASLGVRGIEVFGRVVLPGALPFIVAGIRQGLALSILMLAAAEQTGASSGIGYLITQSHSVFRTDRMLVGLISLGLLGAVVDAAFSRLSRRVVHWELTS
ncbi:ABC transporter permease [Amnibacterium endophyticum]|uniref:ABC transporter permease n=1 Tax=Amnibacterium endophyticum TaxID=2109337 RepID=A0ABW4LHQ9_9MICO